MNAPLRVPTSRSNRTHEPLAPELSKTLGDGSKGAAVRHAMPTLRGTLDCDSANYSLVISMLIILNSSPALGVGPNISKTLVFGPGDGFDFRITIGLLGERAVAGEFPGERLAVVGEFAGAVHDAGAVVVDPGGDELLRDVVEAVDAECRVRRPCRAFRRSFRPG